MPLPSAELPGPHPRGRSPAGRNHPLSVSKLCRALAVSIAAGPAGPARPPRGPLPGAVPANSDQPVVSPAGRKTRRLGETTPPPPGLSTAGHYWSWGPRPRSGSRPFRPRSAPRRGQNRPGHQGPGWPRSAPHCGHPGHLILLISRLLLQEIRQRSAGPWPTAAWRSLLRRQPVPRAGDLSSCSSAPCSHPLADFRPRPASPMRAAGHLPVTRRGAAPAPRPVASRTGPASGLITSRPGRRQAASKVPVGAGPCTPHRLPRVHPSEQRARTACRPARQRAASLRSRPACRSFTIFGAARTATGDRAVNRPDRRIQARLVAPTQVTFSVIRCGRLPGQSTGQWTKPRDRLPYGPVPARPMRRAVPPRDRPFGTARCKPGQNDNGLLSFPSD